jgi:3D (Asp-Asp-Asp) domain-containing protein
MDGRCDFITSLPEAQCPPSGCRITIDRCEPRFPWKLQAVGTFDISMYYYAVEAMPNFTRSRTPVRGLPGREARKDFLFGPEGVPMQGSGILESTGELIEITNPRDVGGWVDREGNQTHDYRRLYSIAEPDAAVFGLSRKELVPFYSVARSLGNQVVPTGTLLFVGGLEDLLHEHGVDGHDGIVRVMDAGGDVQPTQLDLFVGPQTSRIYQLFVSWTNDPRHSSLPVYKLLPSSGVP